MSSFKTVLRKIKYNLSYFFGSDLKYPSNFRFFVRRDTKFQKFINQNCRPNPNEMVDLNNIKIRASKQQGLSGSMVSFFKNNETKKDYAYEFDKTYKEIANQDLSIRTSGSVALDLAYISTGRLDAIWAHGVKLWDVAAGLLIAQESGALISNFNGTQNI